MVKIEDAKINKRWIGEGGWWEDFSLELFIAAPLSFISQRPQAQLAVGFIQSNHLQEISQAWNNGMSANVNFDVHKFLLSDIFVTQIITKERVFRRISLRVYQSDASVVLFMVPIATRA